MCAPPPVRNFEWLLAVWNIVPVVKTADVIELVVRNVQQNIIVTLSTLEVAVFNSEQGARLMYAEDFGEKMQKQSYGLHQEGYGYITDHRVNDLVVVPGALFLSWVIEKGSCLQDIKFQQMVPWSNADDMHFDLTQSSGGESSFTLSGAVSSCVKFSYANHGSPAPNIHLDADDKPRISGAELYEKLNENGNNYGEAFRGVQLARITGEAAVASWSAPKGVEGQARVVSLLDSFTHVLSLLGDRKSLYYLDSIAELVLVVDDIPQQVEIRVQITKRAGNHLYASVIATSVEGELLVCMTDLCVVFSSSQATLSLSMASTFNLEPVTDYMRMWGRRLDIKVQQRMADYGQLFPALIREDSVFDGQSNSQTCFIRLQDWGQTADQEERKIFPESNLLHEGFDTYVLPDNRVVASLNQYETSYLYKEIFLDHTYKRHNVLLSDNDVVIDIGANIGLFSIFAAEQADNVRVIAVEPSPSVLPLLKSNLSTFTRGSTIVAAGASDSRGEAEFTAYKKSSVFSGFMANEDDDRTAIKQIISNMLSAAGSLDEQELEEAAEDMMKDRMQCEQYICPLISVSDIIDEQKLDSVSLLKIDAEKSEEAILKGVRKEHWPIIDQIIIEVHKQSGIGVEGARRLLEQKGFECIEDEEQFLSDSGLVTIYAVRPARREQNAAMLPATKIEQAVELFLDALDRFSTRGNSQKLDIVICPSLVMDPAVDARIRSLEQRIESHLEEIALVNVAHWIDWCNLYPVENPHDLVSDNAGHIPYTREWYAGTGTCLIRNNLFRIRKPRKVIVLDCDNTLWDGVVGEDGVEGVRFLPHNLELQSFVKNLSDNGYILCLASKNDEDIVHKVFEEKSSEMILSWENIVASRINWTNKPENLQSLSEELSLGLDSFVFFDDSPVECEQVRALLPQVLTIQFDEQVGAENYLSNIWELDISISTEEDKKRTALYSQESKRRELRNQFDDVEKFIESIDLRVEISAVDESSIARASQMCMRTNQFNLTSQRHTDADIRGLSETSSTFVEKIRVNDAFGDYGITGLLIYTKRNEELVVDTFLLSCRVLGRSVEHRTAAYIGRKALEMGCNRVVFHFNRTERNAPAELFLESIYTNSMEGGEQGVELGFDAQSLAEVRFKASQKTAIVASTVAKESTGFEIPGPIVHLIASEMNTAKAIVSSLDSKARLPRPKLENAYVAAEGEIQEKIVVLWEDLLGIDGIGVEDNFFHLGGTSLKGVEMISRLQGDLNLKINVAQLFESPTVANLSDTAMGKNNELKPRAVRAKARGRRKPAKRRSDQLSMPDPSGNME